MSRLVQWSRFSDAYQKLFGIQGQTSLNVVDDVFLVLPVEPELEHLSLLRGWRTFSRGIFSPAVAAQFSSIKVTNPAGSGVLAVIEGFSWYPGAPAQAQTGFASNLTASSGQQSRDSRTFQPAGANYPVGALAAAAAGLSVGGNPTGYYNGVTGFPSPAYQVPHVITPGFDFAVECLTVNIAITATIWGKFREMTPQET
jgi:hypothetical protein